MSKEKEKEKKSKSKTKKVVISEAQSRKNYKALSRAINGALDGDWNYAGDC